MAKKPGTNPKGEFAFFNVVYEDDSQRSNRRVPSELLGGLEVRRDPAPAALVGGRQAREDLRGAVVLLLLRVAVELDAQSDAADRRDQDGREQRAGHGAEDESPAEAPQPEARHPDARRSGTRPPARSR